LNKSLLDILVCPRDHGALRDDGHQLTCTAGHRYAIVDGIPVFLLSEVPQTHIKGTRALTAAEDGAAPLPPLAEIDSKEIDPFVKSVIASTNGSLYRYLVGTLNEYPIPSLRLPARDGKLFVEIGCNWGRWCVAAARAGYRVIGVDPSFKSLRAARRAAQQLGVKVDYVVGDGRHLPFAGGAVDQVFSYRVLQHLSKENARNSSRSGKSLT